MPRMRCRIADSYDFLGVELVNFSDNNDEFESLYISLPTGSREEAQRIKDFVNEIIEKICPDK